MLASRVLITAGTPGHMYLEERQAKCLQREAEGEGAGPREGLPVGRGVEFGVHTQRRGRRGAEVQGKLGKRVCTRGRAAGAKGSRGGSTNSDPPRAGTAPLSRVEGRGLTSWPGRWTPPHSAWRTHPQSPVPSHQSTPSRHHPPWRRGS